MPFFMKNQPTSRSLHAADAEKGPETRPRGFLRLTYRLRWPAALVMVAVVVMLAASGGKRVGEFTDRIGSLGDTTNGAGSVPPLVFDPRMDLWFGDEDEVVETYRNIERRFVAEDYLMVTLEDDATERGVFARKPLATIARLTEGFLRVPGVRHVRSLTANPWIRYADIEGESGLVISDLVEGDPLELTDEQLDERMIAVLGARRAAERIGEARVRAVLGENADFDDALGEPLLLGTIVSEDGTTAAIQVQVLRPRVDEAAIAETFADDPDKRAVAPSLYSIQAQRASLRGLQHVLRSEMGLAIPTPDYERLGDWIESLPAGDERDALRADWLDPNRNFMPDANGERTRKFFEYDPQPAAGGIAYVDTSDPAHPVEAPPDFRPEGRSDYEFHLGGVPLFELNFEQVGMSDSKYMGLMFVAIAFLLAVVFRSVAGLVAALLVVFGGIAAMVGGAFGIGALMNNMTMISPNMLTAVGIGDSVHLIASWSKLRKRYASRRELMLEVLRRNALPVFLTSVTTAIGFYSLTVSEMAPVAMFGYMCAFGAVVAYLLSMTVVPAVLSLVPPPKNVEAAPETSTSLKEGGWEARLAATVLKSRRPILAGALLILGLTALGMSRLRIDSDFRAMFPDSNPVMSDFEWIESRMGGVGDVEVVFDASDELAPEWSADERERLASLRLAQEGHARGEAGFEALSGPEKAELGQLEAAEALWKGRRIAVSAGFLEALDAFEARLNEEMNDPTSPLRIVTDLTSPLDILRQMHRVQNENRASYYRVPRESDVPAELRQASLSFDPWTEEWIHVPAQSGSTLAAQYYLQYENGAKPGENLATQISLDRTQFRMQGRIEQSPSELTVDAVERIEEIARDEFPTLTAEANATGPADPGDGVVAPNLKVSGKMFLFARTNRIFTVGFVQSMTLALAAITLLIALIFRSFRMALVSLVPNVLPILLPLSVFGLLGMPLDAPAVFVSSVALGVCVDDTLHFFTNFRRATARGYTLEQSIRYVFETTGRAITITSVILILGFGTLLLSDFSPNFMMGTLAASMIALAWVADMIVTPAVLSLLQPSSTEPETA